MLLFGGLLSNVGEEEGVVDVLYEGGLLLARSVNTQVQY